jgi:hypothetical protein
LRISASSRVTSPEKDVALPELTGYQLYRFAHSTDPADAGRARKMLAHEFVFYFSARMTEIDRVSRVCKRRT